ncbi:AAA domain-containing protein [Halopolyspora algeriensis]|nr:AAA domain-containing protein [Halopolyspora algeriensis]
MPARAGGRAGKAGGGGARQGVATGGPVGSGPPCGTAAVTRAGPPAVITVRTLNLDVEIPDRLMPAPETLPPPDVRIGRRDLVVLAGLPGAGKSTLLGKTVATAPVPVLDPEQVHRVLGAVLPARLPYRRYRAVVHLVHRLRIAWHCVSAPGPVVAHEPSTRPTTRAMLIVLARLTRRRRLLVWVHAGTFEALSGQRERGRLVGARSFARHVERAERLREMLRTGRLPRGWYAARVFTRAELAEGLRLTVVQ